MTEILEIVFEVICYLTARVLVPALSFGAARLERQGDGKFPWHGVKRLGSRIVIGDEHGTLLALVFWVAVVAAAIIIYHW